MGVHVQQGDLFINVKDVAYGAKGDGTTDDRPAIKAAIDAAVALIASTGRGVTVFVPAGTYLFSSTYTMPAVATDIQFENVGVPIATGLSATLRVVGAGRGVTTFKLTSAGSRNLFCINKTAEYQTFKNVTLEDFDVDNNNTAGRGHIVIGNVPSYGGRQARLNYADITVRRVGVLNVPVQADQSTIAKMGVAFIGQHVNSQQDGTAGTALSMEATQTSTRRILVQDVDQYGGDSLANVASWLRAASYQSAGPTNHYYDDISYERCRHFVSSPAAAQIFQTSFYICGSGLGDSCRIIDCYSENIGDDAIEVGAMQNTVIERFRSKDALLIGILFRNTQPPINVNTQRFIVRDTQVKATAALVNATAGFAVPWDVLLDNGCTMGTIELDRFSYELDGLMLSKTGKSKLFCNITSAIQRVVMTSPKVVISNYTYDPTVATDLSVFYVAPSSSNGNVTIIRDADIKIPGLAQTATATMAFHAVMVEGNNARVTIDGLDADFGGVTYNANGGSTSLLTVVKNTSTSVRVVARGIRPRVSTPSNVGKFGVRVYGNGLEQVLITQSNFSFAAGLTSDIDLANATGGNRTRVEIQNNIYLNGTNGSGRTVTAADTILFTDTDVAFNSGATISQALPAASSVIPWKKLYLTNLNTGVVTLTDTISGTANRTLAQYASVTVESNGSIWLLV